MPRGLNAPRDLKFDFDCNLDGGNVIPWAPSETTTQQIATNPIDSFFDFDSPNMKLLNRENLTEFEALMLGEVSNDGCSEDEMDSATTSTSSSDEDSPFPFMDLPLEIRLQVYRWLHLMTPIRLTQFAPWYPNPVNRVYYVKAVTLDEEDSSRCDSHPLGVLDTIPRPIKASSLLSACRPHCCLPTDMLRTSKQIYHECRQLPFLENEFVFVNWFASGLWAARSFIRGLRSWQIQTMRYARLELLSRDLSGRYAEEWRELCESWAAGLKGLRLKILSGGGGSGAVVGTVSWVVAGSPQKGAPTVDVRDADGNAEDWIENGLKQLKQLRCLEVELCVADWDDKDKLDWCRSLEEAVNESKSDMEQPIRVSCVEREARD
ncbi:hypothetical protein F4677DRAFT_175773 [Hypoxylon crocopeplum]|nr:hypothetical protein F4677DRAFT_175773 [Hypoxylon crocopeplum]